MCNIGIFYEIAAKRVLKEFYINNFEVFRQKINLILKNSFKLSELKILSILWLLNEKYNII